MRKLICTVASATFLAGCTHGPKSEDLGFTTHPHGAQAVVRTAAASYQGELIAASDTGFVVLRNSTNSLVFVPATAAVRVHAEPYGNLRMPLGPGDRERLRLVARHPYGLTPQILAALLQAHGQQAIEHAR